VASYVHLSFLARFSVLPRFTETVDIMSLDISSQQPVFGSRVHSFRLVNAYSINSAERRVHSVPPQCLFPDTGIPLLEVGDLTIHNAQSDALRSFASPEVSSSATYFVLAALGGFALLHSQACILGSHSREWHAPPLSTLLLPTPCSCLSSKGRKPPSPHRVRTRSAST